MDILGIGSAIFGQKGLVGGVTDILKNTGIIKDKEAEERVNQALRDYELKVSDNALNELKAHIENTNKARDMQIEALRQGDTFSKRFIYYFAIFITVSTIAYIYFITFGHIPETNVRFADTILGFLLGTLLSTVINFFYGSSKGSDEKTTILHNILKEK